MSVLSEIRSEWATIGTSLNVPDQGLLHLNISDLGKLNATLQVWIDGDGKYSPVCWETVLNAVEGPILNNERVSMRIRHYLRTDKIYEKYFNKDDFTIVGSSKFTNTQSMKWQWIFLFKQVYLGICKGRN